MKTLTTIRLELDKARTTFIKQMHEYYNSTNSEEQIALAQAAKECLTSINDLEINEAIELTVVEVKLAKLDKIEKLLKGVI